MNMRQRIAWWLLAKRIWPEGSHIAAWAWRNLGDELDKIKPASFWD